ncbi:MAG: hypothetical protein H6538_00210 [Bacteroidales bacterium]|nr:hypothetical protein [Bacteroidales bacterium]MCB8998667.1 hypothetical protein [Bacteroidales bacterium]MCB9012465.1 hypothetical protein [Bacteroidales bacterium]
MYKFLFRLVVMTLTILSANLLTSAISDYMISYKNSYKPITFTLIAMGIIVVIFYPLFVKLEVWVTQVSVKAVKKGNSLGGKYAGLLLSFLLALIILTYFYARMWYHLDLFRILIHGNIRQYI